MITIEQKLEQMDKMITENVDKKINEMLDSKNKEIEDSIKKEYELLMDASERTIKQSIERCNRLKTEKYSELMQKSKREFLRTSEKFLVDIISSVEIRCKEFVLSDRYVPFLSNVLKNTLRNEEEINKDSEIIIYISLSSFNELKNSFESILNGMEYSNYQIMNNEGNHIGGFILDAPKLNIRINKTLSKSIENKKEEIGQFLHEYIIDGSVI